MAGRLGFRVRVLDHACGGAAKRSARMYTGEQGRECEDSENGGVALHKGCCYRVLGPLPAGRRRCSRAAGWRRAPRSAPPAPAKPWPRRVRPPSIFPHSPHHRYRGSLICASGSCETSLGACGHHRSYYRGCSICAPGSKESSAQTCEAEAAGQQEHRHRHRKRQQCCVVCRTPIETLCQKFQACEWGMRAGGR